MRLLLSLGMLLTIGVAALNLRPETKPAPVAEDFVLVIQDESAAEESVRTDCTIRLKTEAGIQTMDLEEYLPGVVLAEMPGSFEQEALKAQTVADRTFAARMLENSKHSDCTLCADPSCCQAWLSREQLQKKYGNSFSTCWDKAILAVEETAGQVLTYNGELVEAVYFSCSGGASEPAVAVWGSEVPYLQSVESPGEEAAQKYESQVRVSFSKFKQILQKADPNVFFPVIPEDWIGATVRSDGGGVQSMVLGGVSFSGTKLRSLFSLNSTLFTLSVGDGEMIFSVKGYGHRVGMSQYGANAMAGEGKTCAEILTHYYTGVQIKNLFQTGLEQVS